MGQLIPKNFKPFTRVVVADDSALCYVKWNPYKTTNAAGDTVTAATVEVTANGLVFLVNGSAETVIGTYTGNSADDNDIVFGDTNLTTVKLLIDTINGRGVGHPAASASTYLDRWRAGYGDFRPGFTIGSGDGIVLSAANAMLGRGVEGIKVEADSSALATANTYSAGIGTDHAIEGRGQVIPDHFDSDYLTNSVSAGTERTRTRFPERRQEEQPGLAGFQVYITGIHFGAAYATNAKVVTVFDKDNNTLFQETLGSGNNLAAADQYNIDNPVVVGPAGSPLFVEATGTGALTDGPLTVRGFIRVA